MERELKKENAKDEDELEDVLNKLLKQANPDSNMNEGSGELRQSFKGTSNCPV